MPTIVRDERFGDRPAELLAACRQAGVRRMVVNGVCESDWPAVLALAELSPLVLPSFGYHPWHLHERTTGWLAGLVHFLDAVPSAIGEIGLDRWKPDLPYAGQEEVFAAQLRLAAERNLPVSIDCLRAWGRLLELLSGRSPVRPRVSAAQLRRTAGAGETPGQTGRLFFLPGLLRARTQGAPAGNLPAHYTADRLLDRNRRAGPAARPMN